MPSLPPSWRCECDRLSDATVQVALGGELDISWAPDVDRALQRALTEATLVIVDLRDLGFMDSSGLHVLTRADARARQAGAQLQIRHVTAPVQRLFDLSGAAEHCFPGLP